MSPNQMEGWSNSTFLTYRLKLSILLRGLFCLILSSGTISFSFGQCYSLDPVIFSNTPNWNNFSIDGNPASDEFGILHYYSGSKIIAYGSQVKLHVVGGELANVPTGTGFDGTENFMSGEFVDLAQGDWQVVFMYLPDSRLGYINLKVLPDRIEVNQLALQAPGDPDGIIAGDCSSLDNSILAVELQAFEANPQAQYIQLNWTTISEINNEGFDLQRSADGQNFQSIAWLQGQGNSEKPVHYQYQDHRISKDITYYYRLVSVDYSGELDKSEVIAARVKWNQGAMISEVFPNPVVGNEINIQIHTEKSKEINILLYNGMGNQLRQQKLELDSGKTSYALDTHQLSSGYYYLVVKDNNELYKRRFVVAK